MSFTATYVRSRSSPKSNPRDAGARYGTGMKGFFAWMREKNPRLYAASMPAIKNPTLHGLGITGDDATLPTVTENTGTTPSSIVDSIKSILIGASQAYLTKQQVDAQKKVLNINLQRAQAGLPPLDINMANYGMVPTANVGLSPQTQTLLIWGGAALAAVYLVPKLLRR